MNKLSIFPRILLCEWLCLAGARYMGDTRNTIIAHHHNQQSIVVIPLPFAGAARMEYIHERRSILFSLKPLAKSSSSLLLLLLLLAFGGSWQNRCRHRSRISVFQLKTSWGAVTLFALRPPHLVGRGWWSPIPPPYTYSWKSGGNFGWAPIRNIVHQKFRVYGYGGCFQPYNRMHTTIVHNWKVCLHRMQKAYKIISTFIAIIELLCDAIDVFWGFFQRKYRL